MVVHILNIDAITTVSADPADTLFGEYAVPDINLGTTIDQLRQIPGALQALVTEQLDAQGVLTWASSDEERVEELVGALSALEPSELARMGRLAIWILASVASQPTVLEQSAGKTDEDLLRLAAVATAFARQERAISDLESLLQSDHPESTYQTFLREQHWMFGSQFVGRWPGRQITQGNRQDLILLTPDGFVDMIQARDRTGFIPAKDLVAWALEFKQYLFDIDAELHRIRSKFGIDVHRERSHRHRGDPRHGSGEPGSAARTERPSHKDPDLDKHTSDDRGKDNPRSLRLNSPLQLAEGVLPAAREAFTWVGHLVDLVRSMPPPDERGLSRRILSRVDSKLRSELDRETGEWLVKVPASPAVRAVRKRYSSSPCSAERQISSDIAPLVHPLPIGTSCSGSGGIVGFTERGRSHVVRF